MARTSEEEKSRAIMLDLHRLLDRIAKTNLQESNESRECLDMRIGLVQSMWYYLQQQRFQKSEHQNYDWQPPEWYNSLENRVYRETQRLQEHLRTHIPIEDNSEDILDATFFETEVEQENDDEESLAPEEIEVMELHDVGSELQTIQEEEEKSQDQSEAPPQMARPSKGKGTGTSIRTPDVDVQAMQKAQREQIEEAIAMMASQLKQETSKIRSTLQGQTTNLLEEMEDVAATNVDQVTKVAEEVQTHVQSQWKRSWGTWTLLALVGLSFLGSLFIIYFIPKSRTACFPFCPKQPPKDVFCRTLNGKQECIDIKTAFDSNQVREPADLKRSPYHLKRSPYHQVEYDDPERSLLSDPHRDQDLQDEATWDDPTSDEDLFQGDLLEDESEASQTECNQAGSGECFNQDAHSQVDEEHDNYIENDTEDESAGHELRETGLPSEHHKETTQSDHEDDDARIDNQVESLHVEEKPVTNEVYEMESTREHVEKTVKVHSDDDDSDNKNEEESHFVQEENVADKLNQVEAPRQHLKEGTEVHTDHNDAHFENDKKKQYVEEEAVTDELNEVESLVREAACSAGVDGECPSQATLDQGDKFHNNDIENDEESQYVDEHVETEEGIESEKFQSNGYPPCRIFDEELDPSDREDVEALETLILNAGPPPGKQYD